MPTDTRRLPVPEDTKSPHSYTKDDKLILKPLDDQRHDSRKHNETRPIFMKAGVVSQAKGSAYIEMDKTKVICAVYGPREVIKREEFSMKGQLNCEFKFATFSCRKRRQHQQDSEEKSLSLVLQQALEPAVCMDKFPKARMDIFVTVLQDEGSALSAAISCASVALANGGIEMYDLVVGCTVRQFGKHSLLDPSSTEEYSPRLGEVHENNGNVTVGFMPSIHQVAALVQNGHLQLETAKEAMQLCISSCHKIYPVLQECLVKNVKERLKENIT